MEWACDLLGPIELSGNDTANSRAVLEILQLPLSLFCSPEIPCKEFGAILLEDERSCKEKGSGR